MKKGRILLVAVLLMVAAFACTNASAACSVTGPGPHGSSLTCDNHTYEYHYLDATHCEKITNHRNGTSVINQTQEVISHSFGSPSYVTNSQTHQRTCSNCKGSVVEKCTVVEREVRPATCVDLGQWEAYCSVCNHGYSYGPYKSYGAHKIRYYYSPAPTCGKGGTMVKVCTEGECDYEERSSVEPTGEHTPVSTLGNKPTCCNNGYYMQICSVCSTILVEEYEIIPATGNHPGTVEKIIKAATCDVAGEHEVRCTSTNNIIESGAYGPLGHDYINTSKTKYTQLNDRQHMVVGMVEQTCSRCDFFNEQQSGKGHEETHTYTPYSITKEATCVSKGSRFRTCTKCGYKSVEDIPVNSDAHHLVEDRQMPTCGEDGYYQTICSNAGCNYNQNYTILPATGNHSTYVYAEDAATCTQGGRQYWKCRNCDTVFNPTTTEAKGHHLHGLDDHRAATCTEEGQTEGFVCDTPGCASNGSIIQGHDVIPARGHDTYTLSEDRYESVSDTMHIHSGWAIIQCNRCDYYSAAQSGKGHTIAHEWGQWKTIANATCENAGLREHTCTKCNHKVTEAIDPIKHNYQISESTVANCIQTGKEVSVCTNCSDVQENTLPLDSSNHVQIVNNQRVTYTPINDTQHMEQPQANTVCTACGDVLNDWFSTSKGHEQNHTFDKISVIAEATCTSEGLQMETCSKCEYYKLTIIAKAEHTWVPYPGKNPTETEAGHSAYEQCSVCGEKRNYVVLTPIPPVPPTPTPTPDPDPDPDPDPTPIPNPDLPTTPVPGPVYPGHEGHQVIILDSIAPNCEQWGCTDLVYCTDCDTIIEGEFIKPLGHQIVILPAVEPTETETGLTQGAICDRCGKVFVAQEVIPALNGDSGKTNNSLIGEEVVIPGTDKPVIIEANIDGDVCPVCGHPMSQWVGTGEGVHVRICTNKDCNHIEIATCPYFYITEDKEFHHICPVCGDYDGGEFELLKDARISVDGACLYVRGMVSPFGTEASVIDSWEGQSLNVGYAFTAIREEKGACAPWGQEATLAVPYSGDAAVTLIRMDRDDNFTEIVFVQEKDMLIFNADREALYLVITQ